MQGFNMGRYHAPSSLDSNLSSSSGITKKPHPLGARARKLPQGILTVRFEMPFAIWCGTCPSSSNSQLIGQGVRFNAEKKKVGNYYSTPVWSFRMKHTACGGWIEIRTDPKNSEYVVTDGARRRDIGDDSVVAARTGAVLLDSEREKERLDAFQALEGKAAEKIVAKKEGLRIEELKSVQERDWKDNDAANRKLRARFRVGRKTRERDAESGERLADKMSLGIDILAENEEDRSRAGLVEFGALNDNVDDALNKVTAKPLFRRPELANGDTKTKASSLHEELSSNTRAAFDPFSSTASVSNENLLPRVKRKRTRGNQDTSSSQQVSSFARAETVSAQSISNKSNISTTLGLTAYDSE